MQGQGTRIRWQGWTNLDVEVCRITEHGADAVRLRLHIDFLYFAGFDVILVGLGGGVLFWVLSEGCIESSLICLLGGCRECRSHGRGGATCDFYL